MIILWQLQCTAKPASEGLFPKMPSLFRFLFVVAIIAGLTWGAMQALVTFVEPQQRDMSQNLPASKLNK